MGGDTATPHSPRPLELERVQCSRADAGQLRLWLSGRWLGGRTEIGEGEELLVVNVEGRRHRFPASRDQQFVQEPAPGRWSASFAIPSWAEPREPGQAALWLGTAVIPVPPLSGEPGAGSGGDAGESAPEPGRSGPLADLLQRSSRNEQLDTTLSELRDELGQLREAVSHQGRQLRDRSAEVTDLREQVAAAEAAAELRTSEASALRDDLAAASVSREAALSEAAGLRSELDRVGAELGVTREQGDMEATQLQEATRLLADARALAEELSTDE